MFVAGHGCASEPCDPHTCCTPPTPISLHSMPQLPPHPTAPPCPILHLIPRHRGQPYAIPSCIIPTCGASHIFVPCHALPLPMSPRPCPTPRQPIPPRPGLPHAVECHPFCPLRPLTVHFSRCACPPIAVPHFFAPRPFSSHPLFFFPLHHSSPSSIKCLTHCSKHNSSCSNTRFRGLHSISSQSVRLSGCVPSQHGLLTDAVAQSQVKCKNMVKIRVRLLRNKIPFRAHRIFAPPPFPQFQS